MTDCGGYGKSPFHERYNNHIFSLYTFNPLNAELNPIRHLLALIGARHIVHVSRIGVNSLDYAIRSKDRLSVQRIRVKYRAEYVHNRTVQLYIHRRNICIGRAARKMEKEFING